MLTVVYAYLEFAFASVSLGAKGELLCFELLPIQAEPSLAGLRLQGNYAKEKELTAETESASGAASAMTSGFGFFSAKIKSLAG